jgi:hypothetical protein
LAICLQGIKLLSKKSEKLYKKSEGLSRLSKGLVFWQIFHWGLKDISARYWIILSKKSEGLYKKYEGLMY